MRSKDTLTNKGKQYLQAIQECQARYEAMPTSEQTTVKVRLLRSLEKLATELDGKYRLERLRWSDRYPETR